MQENNPEIGLTIDVQGLQTNYHDYGQGRPVLLLHGSGPGVSAWANWRLTIPALASDHRVIAPDIAGFGFTQRPNDFDYTMENWIEHAIKFMDALSIQKFALVGNSFGGALALGLAIRFPDRVDKLALMGSVGVPFELTEGLDKVWGYTPSFENMKEIMGFFAYDQTMLGDDLVELRYRASIQEGFQESFSSMFPAPRQRWVNEMTHPEEKVRSITCPTLIVHGREDRVIPPITSQRLFSIIENAQLHMYGKCGHWTQIEHAQDFNQLLGEFL